jgi:hypothetical protein
VDLSLGTPDLHPKDVDLSLGTPDLHPKDVDLSLGTPDRGHPISCNYSLESWALACWPRPTPSGTGCRSWVRQARPKEPTSLLDEERKSRWNSDLA